MNFKGEILFCSLNNLYALLDNFNTSGISGQDSLLHTKMVILAWEFVTRSCLKPQNPCSNHEIHVLFEHGFYLKKPKLDPDWHA